MTPSRNDVNTVVEAIEVFAGLRQFEICTPFAKPPLGSSDNYVRSVANRVGADPARAVLDSPCTYFVKRARASSGESCFNSLTRRTCCT